MPGRANPGLDHLRPQTSVRMKSRMSSTRNERIKDFIEFTAAE
jgi:hypothetical protein